MAAIDAVLEELERYHGEQVDAGVHPLHKAVVALEAMVDNRMAKRTRWRTAIPQNLLLTPATHFWFNLLSCSRGGTSRPFYSIVNEEEPVSDVMHWVGRFAKELQSWKETEPEPWARRLEKLA